METFSTSYYCLSCLNRPYTTQSIITRTWKLQTSFLCDAIREEMEKDHNGNHMLAPKKDRWQKCQHRKQCHKLMERTWIDRTTKAAKHYMSWSSPSKTGSRAPLSSPTEDIQRQEGSTLLRTDFLKTKTPNHSAIIVLTYQQNTHKSTSPQA